jgi:hypothetical protein
VPRLRSPARPSACPPACACTCTPARPLARTRTRCAHPNLCASAPLRPTLCAGTVEERIIALQRKKQQVFEATVGGGKDAIGKLSAEDMAFLFS